MGETTMTPEAAQARADQLAAQAADARHAAWLAECEAAQVRHEARLAEERDLTAAEFTGSRQRLERLQQAAEDTQVPETAARRRLAAEKGKLARVQAGQARSDQRDGGVQEALAIRIAAREKAVQACKTALAEATAARETAERQRDDWQGHVTGLEGELAEASRAAENPGPAPDLPSFRPRASAIEDMDPETRALFVLAISALSRGAQQAAPHLASDKPLAYGRGPGGQVTIGAYPLYHGPAPKEIPGGVSTPAPALPAAGGAGGWT
jgi:predicted  nucleic acid-binding Zn-ribbon protein